MSLKKRVCSSREQILFLIIAIILKQELSNVGYLCKMGKTITVVYILKATKVVFHCKINKNMAVYIFKS